MYAECTVLNGPAKFKVSVDYDCEAKWKGEEGKRDGTAFDDGAAIGGDACWNEWANSGVKARSVREDAAAADSLWRRWRLRHWISAVLWGASALIAMTGTTHTHTHKTLTQTPTGTKTDAYWRRKTQSERERHTSCHRKWIMVNRDSERNRDEMQKGVLYRAMEAAADVNRMWS